MRWCICGIRRRCRRGPGDWLMVSFGALFGKRAIGEVEGRGMYRVSSGRDMVVGGCDYRCIQPSFITALIS